MKVRGMRVVVPFRPFPPESPLHQQLADFDWIQALQMVMHSARLMCRCPVDALTDVDTTLPVSTIQVTTTRRRLMLWTLEACAAFLESPAFDRNTVMLDVDQLIFGDLAGLFRKHVDLIVLVRPHVKHTDSPDGQPLLNGVQCWSRTAREPLAAFYRRALTIAERLPDDRIVWGADSDAVRQLLEPIEIGFHERAGLRVWMVDSRQVLDTYGTKHEQMLTVGIMPWPTRPVLDFRWTRKPAMPIVYRAAFLDGAVA